MASVSIYHVSFISYKKKLKLIVERVFYFDLEHRKREKEGNNTNQVGLMITMEFEKGREIHM